MNNESFGSDTTHWTPSADFFDTNPRSQQIRGVCLKIIEALDSPDQTFDPAELEGQLKTLGIEPGVRVYEPEEAFTSDPVRTAEWVAGQLYPLIIPQEQYEQLPKPIKMGISQARQAKDSILEVSRRFLDIPK